jgi:hypothetical protein
MDGRSGGGGGKVLVGRRMRRPFSTGASILYLLQNRRLCIPKTVFIFFNSYELLARTK